MASKTPETEIAILQTQMTDVKTSLEAIKLEQHANFTALAAKIDNLANTPTEIVSINARLLAAEKAIQNSKNWTWARNTLSAVVGAALSLLIVYAITKK